MTDECRHGMPLDKVCPDCRLLSDLPPVPALDQIDAARYRFLRNRDLDTIAKGGVFAGMTPDNIVLNGEDLDRAVDIHMKER